MSNFYACGSYANEIIFKTSQLTAYKFFAKKKKKQPLVSD